MMINVTIKGSIQIKKKPSTNSLSPLPQSPRKEKDEEKQTVQTELDDLLMVFGDLEEKVNRYRERLKAAGEIVTDVEDDDEEEEEEEEK